MTRYCITRNGYRAQFSSSPTLEDLAAVDVLAQCAVNYLDWLNDNARAWGDIANGPCPKEITDGR
jgi:hypothetical protein